MKTIQKILLVATILLCLPGCASIETKAQKLQLGMSKDDAVSLLGSDYTIAAARLDADGTSISVIQYPIKKQAPLCLYFRQNKLVQWGDTSVLNAIPGAAKTN